MVSSTQTADKTTVPRPGFFGLKRTYLYNPLPDVTAYELSELLTFFVCGMSVSARAIPASALDLIWDSLEESSRRHFIVSEKSSIVIPNG